MPEEVQVSLKSLHCHNFFTTCNSCQNRFTLGYTPKTCLCYSENAITCQFVIRGFHYVSMGKPRPDE